MNISIVVPSYNESESLPELCAWIDKGYALPILFLMKL